MKSLTSSLLLALALTTGAWVPVQAQTQTFKQLVAAHERKDYDSAYSGFKKLAEQGNARAQFKLGGMYAKGQGVLKSVQKAMDWYHKAAVQGDFVAQYILDRMFKLDAPEDEQQQVVKWYRKAAEQGNASAQFNLGSMYADGRGVPVDENQAVAWYHKAAAQGNATAQYNLGGMHEDGRGVPKEDQQAVVWYRKAAVQGEAFAQFDLGRMYLHGQGVPKNEKQAVVWLRKAAVQGIPTAQTLLGSMYHLGIGLPENKQSAYFWWLLASAKGDQDAVRFRDRVERHLSPTQRAAAQAAARNWQPKTAVHFSNAIR